MQARRILLQIYSARTRPTLGGRRARPTKIYPREQIEAVEESPREGEKFRRHARMTVQRSTRIPAFPMRSTRGQTFGQFGHSNCLFLRELRQIGEMPVSLLRCDAAQDYVEIAMSRSRQIGFDCPAAQAPFCLMPQRLSAEPSATKDNPVKVAPSSGKTRSPKRRLDFRRSEAASTGTREPLRFCDLDDVEFFRAVPIEIRHGGESKESRIVQTCLRPT